MEENRSANLKVNQELKTCAAKTENLQNLIQYKLEENEKLRDELEASQSENNAKNVEIKRLKLKLEVFENNLN
jgi:predicted nuclease with TOPRIM domain